MTHGSKIMIHKQQFFPRVVGLNASRSGGAAGNKGFTMVELIVVTAVLGVLASMAIPFYNSYLEKTRNGRAMAEIRTLSTEITGFSTDNGGAYPIDLGRINRGGFKDPWNRLYQYNNFTDLAATPALKDAFDPENYNKDFDVYSLGVDGLTNPAGVDNGTTTKDDIIRTNDGSFIGLREH